MFSSRRNNNQSILCTNLRIVGLKVDGGIQYSWIFTGQRIERLKERLRSKIAIHKNAIGHSYKKEEFSFAKYSKISHALIKIVHVVNLE